jgi:hypothetical protein
LRVLLRSSLIYILSKYIFQVTDLLGKHSDLMSEFNDYLERCENTGNCFATLLFNVIFEFSHALRFHSAYLFLQTGFLLVSRVKVCRRTINIFV